MQRSYYRLFLCGLCGLLARWTQAAETPDTPLDSVVLIETDLTRGTGFVCKFGGSNYVVTCSRVIEAAKAIEIRSRAGQKFRPDLIELADTCDLVRLRIPDSDVAALSKAAAPPHKGMKVCLYSDEGGMGSITRQEGDVAVEPRAGVFGINAQFREHSTGAPILNALGALVGVAEYREGYDRDPWYARALLSEKPKREGLVLSKNLKWVEVPYAALYAQAAALRDIELFLHDTHQIARWLDTSPQRALVGFNAMQASRETLRAKRYRDAAYADLLLKISRHYVEYFENAEAHSATSHSVRIHARGLVDALGQIPRLVHEKTQRLRLSTQQYRARLRSSLSMLETWNDLLPVFAESFLPDDRRRDTAPSARAAKNTVSNGDDALFTIEVSRAAYEQAAYIVYDNETVKKRKAEVVRAVVWPSRKTPDGHFSSHCYLLDNAGKPLLTRELSRAVTRKLKTKEECSLDEAFRRGTDPVEILFFVPAVGGKEQLDWSYAIVVLRSYGASPRPEWAATSSFDSSVLEKTEWNNQEKRLLPKPE
ncbi:MAG: trypsin-like peptidase domain-containing protein [Kiritimatiellae bacterium]|nr:trypsin-like peptidase domain-containing protein [Kiritimatiellia bacterium]